MNGRGDILYAGIGTPPRPRGAWERGTGGEGMFKSKPGIQENKGLFAGSSFFACPKEVTKERAPREKPFSPFTARFSGMCELTTPG